MGKSYLALHMLDFRFYYVYRLKSNIDTEAALVRKISKMNDLITAPKKTQTYRSTAIIFSYYFLHIYIIDTILCPRPFGVI